MELKAQIVQSGTWLYDGISPHEVWIVKQNFDYYDDEGYQDTPCVSPDEEVFRFCTRMKDITRVCHSCAGPSKKQLLLQKRSVLRLSGTIIASRLYSTGDITNLKSR
jgi:hypothetical protein